MEEGSANDDHLFLLSLSLSLSSKCLCSVSCSTAMDGLFAGDGSHFIQIHIHTTHTQDPSTYIPDSRHHIFFRVRVRGVNLHLDFGKGERAIIIIHPCQVEAVVDK